MRDGMSVAEAGGPGAPAKSVARTTGIATRRNHRVRSDECGIGPSGRGARRPRTAPEACIIGWRPPPQPAPRAGDRRVGHVLTSALLWHPLRGQRRLHVSYVITEKCLGERYATCV